MHFSRAACTALTSLGLTLFACTNSTLNAGSSADADGGGVGETSTAVTTRDYWPVLESSPGNPSGNCKDNGICNGDLSCIAAHTSAYGGCKPLGSLGEPSGRICTTTCSSDADCTIYGVTFRCFEDCSGGATFCANATPKRQRFSQEVAITSDSVVLTLTEVESGAQPIAFDQIQVTVTSVGLPDVQFACSLVSSSSPNLLDIGSVMRCEAPFGSARGLSRTSVGANWEAGTPSGLWTSEDWTWNVTQ